MSRGLYSKGKQRREEILSETLRLLAEDGFRQTSLNAIARALGTSTSTLVHYFGTREGLLEAVLARWDSVPDQADGTTDFALEQWVRTVEHNASIPGIIRLYSSLAAEAAPPEHPSHAFFEARFAWIHARVTAGISAKQERGLIAGTLESAATASRLIALSDGLQLQWLFDPRVEMSAHLRHAIESLRAAQDIVVLQW
ncbi:MAG: TetR/AcrR family transcriptional regulator [Leifsonia sp.]